MVRVCISKGYHVVPCLKKTLTLGLVFLIVFSLLSYGIRFWVCNGSKTNFVTDQNTQKIQEAAAYVENMYDARIGLVSESEDNGSNVPDRTPCWRTFWVYSDNLWASEALKHFNLATTENISETVARYINEVGNSQLFEVVLGTAIPTPIHAHTNIGLDSFIFDGLNHTVWADRHQPQDGGIFFDADQYADLCFYLSLNYALQRNNKASEQWFRTGESYWDGHGFFDKAANESAAEDQDKRYQNYKLGLYLFTVKATGFDSSIYDAVENAAWSYQKANGGIASQSYLNGTIYGTANVETTSILLLAYNNEALAKFTNMNTLTSLLVIIIVAIVLIVAAAIVAIRCSHRRTQKTIQPPATS
jgi:flagellar basal body-associated protein FliL